VLYSYLPTYFPLLLLLAGQARTGAGASREVHDHICSMLYAVGNCSIIPTTSIVLEPCLILGIFDEGEELPALAFLINTWFIGLSGYLRVSCLKCAMCDVRCAMCDVRCFQEAGMVLDTLTPLLDTT
jgi:hypothetical protein